MLGQIGDTLKTTKHNRGFTLVELMIVVAIVGVLAALAIYGVSAYLSSSKAAEAKNNIGGISRSAVAAFERVNAANELLAAGSAASGASQSLCITSTVAPSIPAAVGDVKGKKYQPKTAAGNDFSADTSTTGWNCLKFSISQPIYYQLGYFKNSGDFSTGKIIQTGASSSSYFVARAQGDTTSSGTKAKFLRGGVVRDGKIVTSTNIWTENESQ